MRAQKSLALIGDADEAAANIKKYSSEFITSAELRSRAGYVRSWYAMREEGGRWRFAPSKFVGYRNNSARKYLEQGEKTGIDGRDTERVLERWFRPVDSASRMGQELGAALVEFLSQYSQPNVRARINVSHDEAASVEHTRKAMTDISARIVATAEVCGGRPRIKGTRMRVSDLLDMLAGGASREEILADFPYIKDDDINAALAFAARAASHRIIRAA